MVAYWLKALKNFILAIPSLVDISSDGGLVYDFLHGANYTYRNITKEYTECVTDEITGDYKCWEQHYIFGFLTLSFILLPGLGLLGGIADGNDVRGVKVLLHEARERGGLTGVCLLCWLTLLMILSPVLVTGCKLGLIFYQTDILEEWSLYLGQGEASLVHNYSCSSS